ncbi:MAG TPA: O-antigen ligase family protein [Thermoanaerobaculia bacterium]|nr:O-antigen ligase family protein [Thermoanaerobaculia bacterium]
MKTAPRSSSSSLASTLAEIFVWAILIITPFLFVPAKESFRLPKLLVAEWLAMASLLCLAWNLRNSGAGGAGLRDVWRLPAVRAVLPALLVATAGILTTAHPLRVRESLFDFWIGAACLIGWSAGLERERQERLLRGLIWPAGGLAFVGILQFYRLWEPLRFTGIDYDVRLGVTSFAGNPGDLSSYLVLPCLIALWSFPGLRPGPWRWLAGAALALCLYGLAITQTLASLAAVAAGAAVFALLRLPRRKVLIGMGAAAVAAVVLVAAVGPLRVRVLNKVGQLAGGDLNQVLTGRLDGWRAALWMLREQPLTGVGHGAYLPEYIPAKLELLDRGVEFLPGHTNPVFSNAHNELLQVGAEWGIPGLLALAWGLWVVIRTAARKQWDPGNRALAWSGLTALALLSLAYFPFHVALVSFPALLFLAWVLRPEPQGDQPE